MYEIFESFNQITEKPLSDREIKQALAKAASQPKGKVSLAKAPWDKDEEVKEGGMSDIDIQAQEFAQDAIEMAKDIQKDDYYFSDSTYFEFTDGLDMDNDALIDHDLVQTVLRALPNVDMEDEEIKQAVDALANMNIKEGASKVNEGETGTVIFHADDGGIGVHIDGKPKGWAGHPKELAQMLSKMGVDASTPMFHSSDVDFASEEGFDSDDGAHDMIDSALEMMGLSESSCKRMNEADVEENAFNQAAAAAARAGKDSFEFDGKTHKTTMKKDTAHQLDDDVQDDDMVERKLSGGEKHRMKDLEKKMDKKDFIERYGKEKGESVYYATVTKMAKKDSAKAKRKKADENTTSGSVAASASTDSANPYGNPSIYESAYNKKIDAVLSEGMNVSMSSSTDGGDSLTVTATDDDAHALARLLKMAGMPAPADKGCGCGATPCECGVMEEDLANSPDPQYSDTDTMVNTLSGGLNGKKTTGQTTGAPVNRDARRGSLGDVAESIEQELHDQLWENYSQYKK